MERGRRGPWIAVAAAGRLQHTVRTASADRRVPPQARRRVVARGGSDSAGGSMLGKAEVKLSDSTKLVTTTEWGQVPCLQ